MSEIRKIVDDLLRVEGIQEDSIFFAIDNSKQHLNEEKLGNG
jgi:hypothetical protein